MKICDKCKEETSSTINCAITKTSTQVLGVADQIREMGRFKCNLCFKCRTTFKEDLNKIFQKYNIPHTWETIL